MKSNATAIIVLGLGVNYESKIVTYLWEKQGVRVIFFRANWRSREDYKSKLKRLLNLIDEESVNTTISLVGASAGGSLVLNAFGNRKNKVNKVVTVCSRLMKDKLAGFRGFVNRTRGYPAFSESVINAEKKVLGLKNYERKRIMTVHALFGDELVSANTSIINGAYNTVVPTGEHVLSIVSSLTVFSGKIVRFIVGK